MGAVSGLLLSGAVFLAHPPSRPQLDMPGGDSPLGRRAVMVGRVSSWHLNIAGSSPARSTVRRETLQGLAGKQQLRRRSDRAGEMPADSPERRALLQTVDERRQLNHTAHRDWSPFMAALQEPPPPHGPGGGGFFFSPYDATMDIGADARKKASETATHIVELAEAGCYIGDDSTLVMAHVCLALEHMIESAQTRMSEASDALHGMQLRMHRAERESGRIALEVLPPGWYWDLDDEARARKVDSVDFCEPAIGNQIRAVGMTPPRVQMAVDMRASRLAIENGSLRTPDSVPAEFCIVVADGTERASGPYFTLEEAVEAGHATGQRYRAGHVFRPRASEYLRLDDITQPLQAAAASDAWTERDVFQSREGASELLEMAFDAAFRSDQWRIADDALRYPVNSRKPVAVRAV